MTNRAQRRREHAAAKQLEAEAAQAVIDRLHRAGVDPDHVIASTVHEAGYVDDRDDQLHAWPAHMDRGDVLLLVQLEEARRVFEERMGP
jgi:hypothetical protein